MSRCDVHRCSNLSLLTGCVKSTSETQQHPNGRHAASSRCCRKEWDSRTLAVRYSREVNPLPADARNRSQQPHPYTSTSTTATHIHGLDAGEHKASCRRSLALRHRARTQHLKRPLAVAPPEDHHRVVNLHRNPRQNNQSPLPSRPHRKIHRKLLLYQPPRTQHLRLRSHRPCDKLPSSNHSMCASQSLSLSRSLRGLPKQGLLLLRRAKVSASLRNRLRRKLDHSTKQLYRMKRICQSLQTFQQRHSRPLILPRRMRQHKMLRLRIFHQRLAKHLDPATQRVQSVHRMLL